MHCFTFFLFKCLKDQIWPCSKIGQGQLRVIIYIIFIGLKSLSLLSKFQGNLIYGSGEKDFKQVITLYGHDSHLGHVTRTNYINFCSCEA